MWYWQKSKYIDKWISINSLEIDWHIVNWLWQRKTIQWSQVSVFSINGAKTTEHPWGKTYNTYFIHANLFQTEQTEIRNGKLQNSKITQEKIQTTLGMRQCFRNNTNFAIDERTNLVSWDSLASRAIIPRQDEKSMGENNCKRHIR